MLRSISAKVVTAGVLLVMCATGIVTTVLYNHAKRDLETLQASEHFAMASRLAATFDNILSEKSRAVESVAKSISADALNNPNQLQQILNQRPALQALFPEGVVIVNEKGEIVADWPVLAARKNTNVSSRQWFEDVSHNTIFFTIIGRTALLIQQVSARSS